MPERNHDHHDAGEPRTRYSLSPRRAFSDGKRPRGASVAMDLGSGPVTAIATYARPVWTGIIDGEAWIAERLSFLQKRLSEITSATEREVIEAEIAALSKEVGLTCTGLPGLRRLRRLPQKR